jgi:hypothetical protein
VEQSSHRDPQTPIRKGGAEAESTAQGDTFSFDLGGNFLGGDVDGEVFLAESKKYANAAGPGTELP